MKEKEHEETRNRRKKKVRKKAEKKRRAIENVKNNEGSCKFYRVLTNRSSIVHIFKKEQIYRESVDV